MRFYSLLAAAFMCNGTSIPTIKFIRYVKIRISLSIFPKGSCIIQIFKLSNSFVAHSSEKLLGIALIRAFSSNAMWSWYCHCERKKLTFCYVVGESCTKVLTFCLNILKTRQCREGMIRMAPRRLRLSLEDSSADCLLSFWQRWKKLR